MGGAREGGQTDRQTDKFSILLSSFCWKEDLLGAAGVDGVERGVALLRAANRAGWVGEPWRGWVDRTRREGRVVESYGRGGGIGPPEFYFFFFVIIVLAPALFGLVEFFGLLVHGIVRGNVLV